jgi:hypothetical protein
VTVTFFPEFQAFSVPSVRNSSLHAVRGKNVTNVMFFQAKRQVCAVYTNMTEPDIICRQSAFKHGVTEADIHWAFKTVKYDSPMDGDEGIANVVERRLLIGFNTNANLLEIMYYELDDGTACVFFGNLAAARLPPQCHAGINLFRY